MTRRDRSHVALHTATSNSLASAATAPSASRRDSYFVAVKRPYLYTPCHLYTPGRASSASSRRCSRTRAACTSSSRRRARSAARRRTQRSTTLYKRNRPCDAAPRRFLCVVAFGPTIAPVSVLGCVWFHDWWSWNVVQAGRSRSHLEGGGLQGLAGTLDRSKSHFSPRESSGEGSTTHDASSSPVEGGGSSLIHLGFSFIPRGAECLAVLWI